MGNLIDSLRQLVREEIKEAKQGRISRGLEIADQDKVNKIKQLYPEDNMIYKIVTAIENKGDKDMTRSGYRTPAGEFINGLVQILDMKNTKFNPHIKELISSGVLVDKSEPTESTPKRGKRGRPASGEDILTRRVNRELSEQSLHEVYRKLQNLK